MNHPSIPVHEALQVAELAAPAPREARLALLALIQLLQQIRDHAGLSCALEDIPEAVAAMRRAGVAIPAVLEEFTPDMSEVLAAIIRDVAELPDRTSPDDQPEMMLVSADELHDILDSHLSSRTELLLVAESRP